MISNEPEAVDRSILLATRNAGKVSELADMLAPLGVTVVGLDSFPAVPDVDETGTTFLENAILKASGYARGTGLVALADDSGLEVAALGGRPGVVSARYGGEDTPFAEKMAMLLGKLRETGSADRSARFVCAIACASAEGEIVGTATGICDGRIAAEPRGKGGFGYDPIFIPDGFDETFGELPGAVKAQMSHRGRAFLQIMPFLARFFGDLT